MRAAAGAAVVGAAVWAGWRRHGTLVDAGHLLRGVRPGWLLVAAGAEAASMAAMARLQRGLLRAGGVPVPGGQMVRIVLAANALGTSLPGGVAWGATWELGQLRRRGADRVLAGWVVLAAGALSSFALFVLIALGAFLAGGRGPVAGLRWLAALLAAVPVGVGVVAVWCRRSAAARRGVSAGAAALGSRFPRAARAVERLFEQLDGLRPGAGAWVSAFGAALANWLFNAACLVACLVALHQAVPWRGVLVVYALTQVSASLPVTPGGLGVVEGSMAGLLVAYGVAAGPALAVVLLYRIVSFWGVVPVGWASWLDLEVRGQASRRLRAIAPATRATAA
ncbi:MAG TPA: YbhN family protein [Acidimicrobiales bacterium]|nr:YbhN family protein [Acidimicrobiales bacterium]